MLRPSATVSLVVGLPGDAKTLSAVHSLHRKLGAKTEQKLPLIHGFTVQVPEGQVDAYLASLPPSATVMKDEPLLSPAPPTRRGPTRTSDQLDDDMEMTPASVEDGVMPYVSRPFGSEELQIQGIDGRGVTLAVIDSGLYPHQDFQDRIKAFKNFTWSGGPNPHDEYGHGTDVASVAAGDGELIDGVAPKASLVGARIVTPSDAIKAIDWVIEHKEEYGIGVLNLSLGSPAIIPSRMDPFAQATQRAIDAGILTVVAAGNECTETVCAGTISTPGTLQDAITVGAYDDHQTAGLEDDTMWGSSSNGPTIPDGISKPDLVAPGARVIGLGAPGSELRGKRERWKEYIVDNGTSLASPMVGGALALMLQVYPGLTQAVAKDILQRTAVPMDRVDPLAQGAGRMNLSAAVAEARRLSTAS